MTVQPHQSLGEIVTESPSLARELERRGLDYCCGGSSTLQQACTERGLDVTTVIAELDALGASDVAPAWSTMGAAQLVRHIESTHHRYLWDELPRLSALCTKVASVHGGNHPELAEIHRVFDDIRSDLEPHLLKEEQRLFPMISELAVSESPSAARSSIEQPISVMLREHDVVGKLFAHLRDLTDGYHVPDDGCASYTALYAGLDVLEADTHLHIHKENNLLFPMVVHLEQRMDA